MNYSRITLSLLLLTLVLAPQSKTSAQDPTKKIGAYSAKLITPRAGDVLLPGQHVKITWDAVFPKLDLSWCEAEIFLSVDGGKTFTLIVGERDPRVQEVDWIVPNTPTDMAVMDLHFGCLGRYPETDSVQIRSPFVIGRKVSP